MITRLKSHWRWPRVIAHRGGGAFAPENTLAAIREGQRRGYRGVEFDVMLTADGVPILIHDETLERTTNGHGRVSEQSWSSLNSLDAGAWFDPCFARENLPSFEEAARLCVARHLWANIEIKPSLNHDAETGIRAARIARAVWSASAPQDWPLLSSFSTTALAAARREAPEFPRGMLYDGVPDNWRETLVEHACASLHCNQAKLTRDLAHTIVDAGYGLAVWTVNDAADARRLFDWGVDAIFTDRLDLIGPDFPTT